MKFNNLNEVNKPYIDEIGKKIREIIEHGYYILSEEVKSLEEELSFVLSNNRYTQNVATCNSGTDAITLSLLAAGIDLNSEVITVTNTAFPTYAAIKRTGAKVKFVDIDEETWLLDISKVKNLVTDNTKAIVPVHMYGNVLNIHKLREELDRLGREDIVIVEDTAHAFGATINHEFAGTMGEYGAFSFYPTKNLGAIGDGGAIYTSSNVETIKELRNYGLGKDKLYKCANGMNSRLDELQAAILRIKLQKVFHGIERNREIVERYRQELADSPIRFQKVSSECNPAWHLCPIQLENQKVRDGLKKYLVDNDVEVLIHYEVPIHKQIKVEEFDLHISEDVASRILSIPLNYMLSDESVDRVIQLLKKYFK